MTYLDALLNYHWLRPETAIWRTLDCMLMHVFPLEAPSLDLGCGDGSLSFMMAGGTFPATMDAYRTITDLSQFTQGADIYNAAPQESRIEGLDLSGLQYRFTTGLDHKEGLIARASSLDGFYQTLVTHDANRPLPLEDASLQSIFSNILYWLEDPEASLREVWRVLQPGGKLLTFLPHETFMQQAWVYFSAEKPPGYEFLKGLDRGYHQLIRHCHGFGEWRAMAERAGFRVMHHHQYLSEPIMDVWNVGLRPICHLLIQMVSKLNETDRLEEKAKWVAFFHDLFAPLVEAESRRESNPRGGFHFFVLERENEQPWI